jgi:hypothetical protein
MENNKSNQQAQVAVPQLSKQEWLENLAELLAEYQWPKGAIECLDPDNTKLVFLWGNRFKGNAEGGWTAKVNGSFKLTINDKEVTVKDGTSYSGGIPSSEFDLLVIDEDPSMPYWAKDFYEVGFENENLEPYSSIAQLGGVIEGSASNNPLSAWMRKGNAIVDRHLMPTAIQFSENGAIAYNALNLFPTEVIKQSLNMFSKMTVHSRDVEVASRHNVTEDATPVLIPFYVLEFNFEGKQYHLATMADGKHLTKGKVPPVPEDYKTPQEQVEEEMADKIKQVKLLKWGWIVAIILLFVFNLTVAVIWLIVWGGGYWYMKRSISSRLNELTRIEEDNDKKIAAKIKKQLLR